MLSKEECGFSFLAALLSADDFHELLVGQDVENSIARQNENVTGLEFPPVSWRKRFSDQSNSETEQFPRTEFLPHYKYDEMI